MGRPCKAADLQQFLCAVNWMRNNIPNYSALVQVRLDEHECGPSHDQCLQLIKDALCAMVPMAQPNEDWKLCVYTDAYQDHWGAIVTQVGPGELEKPLSEKVHVPLAFIVDPLKELQHDGQQWRRKLLSLRRLVND